MEFCVSVIFILLGPHIFLSTPFSRTLSPSSSLSVGEGETKYVYFLSSASINLLHPQIFVQEFNCCTFRSEYLTVSDSKLYFLLASFYSYFTSE